MTLEVPQFFMEKAKTSLQYPIHVQNSIFAYICCIAEELFPSRDFELGLVRPDTESGTPPYGLRAELCPRPGRVWAGLSCLKPSGKFESRTDASSCKGKEASGAGRERVFGGGE